MSSERDYSHESDAYYRRLDQEWERAHANEPPPKVFAKYYVQDGKSHLDEKWALRTIVALRKYCAELEKQLEASVIEEIRAELTEQQREML